MSIENRRVWTKEEDEHMVRLQGQLRGDWNAVAREMQRSFPRISRTAKQCKERWTNHLDPSISRLEWDRKEITKFVDLWLDCGNRWTRLAASMQGRSENSLKNFFYSNLRRTFKILQEDEQLSSDRTRKLNRLSVDWICEMAQGEKTHHTLLKEFVCEALWIGLEKKKNPDSPMRDKINAIYDVFKKLDNEKIKSKSKSRTTLQSFSVIQKNQLQSKKEFELAKFIQTLMPDQELNRQQGRHAQQAENPANNMGIKMNQIRRVKSIEIARPNLNSPSVSFYGQAEHSLMNVSDTPSFLKVFNSHMLAGSGMADAVIASFWMMS